MIVAGRRARRGPPWPRCPRPPARAGRSTRARSSGLGARNIGSAAMSGRVSAVAAVATRTARRTIYVGAASGGVWKSTDGGTTFKPVFDKQPVQSIGAIAIDPSQPTRRSGSAPASRGRATRSRSATGSTSPPTAARPGRTWACRESERIARIIVEPEERRHGLRLRARQALERHRRPRPLQDERRRQDLDAGAQGREPLDRLLVASAMDPKNPDVLFAGLWDFRRKGWTFRSGGERPDAPSGQRPVPLDRRRQDLDAS